MSELLLDRAGRRRSPASMPGFHAGRPPRNKGLRYPADPPKVEEIIAVMRAAGDGAHGRRLRGLIVILWRAGLRIQEALALTEADLDQRRGWSDAARADAAAKWEWTIGAGRSSSPGSSSDSTSPSDAVLHHQRCDAGPTLGTRSRTRPTPPHRGRSRRSPAFAPHQLRHAHAVEMAREGVPLIVIQRQLGHSNLGTTSVYLQGIDNAGIIETVHARRAPMIAVSASPRL
jgi:integrase